MSTENGGAPAGGAASAPKDEKPDHRKVITLSTGKVARCRGAIGRDLEKGAMVAMNPSSPMSLMMGVAAQVTEIDGKPIVYEDILEMDLVDVMQLIGAVGGNVASPGLAISRGLPA